MGASMTILEVPSKSLKFTKESLLKIIVPIQLAIWCELWMFHKKVLLRDR